MNEPDAGQVKRRLAVVINKKRNAAIAHMLLSVLYTPACEKIWKTGNSCLTISVHIKIMFHCLKQRCIALKIRA